MARLQPAAPVGEIWVSPARRAVQTATGFWPGGDFHEDLNPDSLRVLTGCVVEPGLAEAGTDDRFQFEREGYFCVDPVDSRPDQLVFNRIVSLRDSWAKQAAG